MGVGIGDCNGAGVGTPLDVHQSNVTQDCGISATCQTSAGASVNIAISAMHDNRLSGSTHHVHTGVVLAIAKHQGK